MGRPTKYTQELADEICETMSQEDKGIKQLCRENPHWPSDNTIFKWRLEKQDFSRQYYAAKEKQAEVYAESTLEIAQQKHTFVDKDGNEKVDPGHVAWQKLNVNARQWHASKLNPRYSDKQTVAVEESKTSDALREEILKLRAELEAEKKKDY